MGRSKAPSFGDFWKAYPVHKSRIEAEAAWNRLSATDRQRALAGIAAYREECMRTGVACCYGQKYLNKRRWEDEPSTTEAPLPPATEGVLDGMETW